MAHENVRAIVGSTLDQKAEPPRPLTRELPPADPFPVDALGTVLAAATLAVQGHANVALPMGHAKPLSSFFVSVAATGERKTAADQEAAWPVRKREAMLRAAFPDEHRHYENAEAAWKKARDAAARKGKGDLARIKQMLDALGPAPPPPLQPILTCSEPTFEGLCKLLAVGWPSVGIFAAEGGQFVGGHGMADDAKLRTASGLSGLWDGEPIKRVRALDGFTVLPGRRVAMHLMVQPDVAAIWFGDRLLAEQGLMSRILMTAPASTSGERIWKEPPPTIGLFIKRYGARLLEIFERPLPLAEGTRNELAPRTVPLSPEARRHWIGFHDYVEQLLGAGGEFEPIRGLANKLPEHAARIGAVLALVDDIEAGEVGTNEMKAGFELAEHYAAEALRLFGSSHVHADLLMAQRLWAWLSSHWGGPTVSLPDVYQRGLNAIGDQATARKLIGILEDHGYVVKIPEGATVAGNRRREAWRINREV
jgi:hypothetical protein